MKVTSNVSVHFPKLGWSIEKGETKELPKDEVAQKRILSEQGITLVEEEKIKGKSDNK